MATWNPWHGCTKVSTGCSHCYVYRRNAEFGRDTSVVKKTASFNLPIRRNRQKEYKLQPDGDYVYTCFTSDFFHQAADEWRPEAWAMMKERSDLQFYFVTKRPERFHIGLPDDWGNGYDNVHIVCTCENQFMTNRRLPIFLELPIKHKEIIHEPMLEYINLRPFLEKYHSEIEMVSCGGESGDDARICDYGWVLSTMTQCIEYNVAFHFHQTGYNFRRGKQIYHISRKDQHEQAAKAGIDFRPIL
ncbi:MAG: phage Gp37/Gp68 family protein [Clostridiales bacterium]|nr:phage Gp37/Gp68 family protein [Clostridiales bacterium]